MRAVLALPKGYFDDKIGWSKWQGFVNCRVRYRKKYIYDGHFITSFQPGIHCSVQISCSVMSNSLQTHRLQHARLHSPSLSPGVRSDSCPLSWWCYLTNSSSAASSPFAFNLSQHQGLYQRVGSSYQVAKYWNFSFSISPSDECLGSVPPLLLLPSIFPSIRVFCNELALHTRWPNIGVSASAISPSDKYSGFDFI